MVFLSNALGRRHTTKILKMLYIVEIMEPTFSKISGKYIFGEKRIL